MKQDAQTGLKQRFTLTSSFPTVGGSLRISKRTNKLPNAPVFCGELWKRYLGLFLDFSPFVPTKFFINLADPQLRF